MTWMSIGELARESGLTPKALRLYGELGLLEPAEVDPFTGYRRYRADQLATARLVAVLRLVGMPLARIREVLAQADDGAAAAAISAYWRQVEADTESRREVVTALVRRLHQQETTMPDSTSPTLHPFRTTVGTSSLRGARESQQDAVLVADGAVAVADGFGTHDDVADTVLAAFASGGYASATATAVGAEDGGTTLTALTLDGTRVRLTHVGDGRAYLVRDGHAVRLTHDHTMVAGLVESGELTDDEARTHPRRSLLNRAVGSDRDAPDTARIEVRSGDRLVLTTDGVHAVLAADELADLLTTPRPPQQVADAVAAAVARAGEPDNHTVVVLDLSARGR